MIEGLNTYLTEILGIEANVDLKTVKISNLPFYINERFDLYATDLLSKTIIIAECKPDAGINTQQLEKHVDKLREATEKPVVLVAEDLSALERRRLIHKGINFIVPGKQLFIPELLMDFREQFSKKKIKKDNLAPSSQVLLLYHILHRDEKMERMNLKLLANKFGYTQMGISKVGMDLVNHGLCELVGTKEKYIRFHEPVPRLWQLARPLLVNPVLKNVYTDNLPPQFLLRSNLSALPEYTDVAEGKQEYRAIDKHLFYSLEKENQLIDTNDFEGKYCLEIWKYNPKILAGGLTTNSVIDPLSLYLSLTHLQDERVEMGLDQIVQKFIW